MHQYDRLQRILTGKPFHYTVMFFIVASIAAVIGSSFETMRPYRHLLFGINYLASFVFLVEYVLRIAAAEAAVVTSGTATLETALLGTPEVVVYRTLWFQVKLQPYVLKVPWVSLVNLNLGREAVAEIIQSDLSIERAERELRAILPGGSGRARMLADLAELRAVIGGPGASERFARRMVGELRDDTKQ